MLAQYKKEREIAKIRDNLVNKYKFISWDVANETAKRIHEGRLKNEKHVQRT